ncbi:UDP-N-acetylmuramoyl-L-alanyl-D-glutamate--2,6-diaminopimelate ligase [Ruficoccus sp. ZRK36]|uniref:UDP-N-acetylmuramoyl-L-alanyl-D-glutamate--2, 6-diaminopimelate ligase n=1 Tax=Ruficoccus sp. ZRK36 TaxID=2866311 RepID=UPI001C73BF38|nr:UDP-N-acetylmuramoyl-L-alanyl-D-glutamate--2,6-diaminopimelate ligase [Ruficoccus sp. ZRK36]QYY35781.1 UDP-N-acetylmuramoyl-L-alanyl-D-glutamate--2,6-diaminopimelate ligase [Ruficoccus sp. ZRK36]
MALPGMELLLGGLRSGRRPFVCSFGMAGGGSSTTGPQWPTLDELVKDLPVVDARGEGKAAVRALVTDSRRVAPGSLFFAQGGLRTDGNLYIEEAIDRGAVGIISESPAESIRQVPYLQVKDCRATLAEVARRYYGRPDDELKLFGITGTNGKTTVAFLAQHLLADEPDTVGLIGTVHYDLGKRTLPSYKTTPESVDIYSMLNQMVSEGCKQAVLEVSSHAIQQQRVDGVRFPVAAFLNLTQDHIDYHRNMEAYFEAKTRLFTGALGSVPETVLINIDDPYGRRLVGMIPEGVRIITFGVCADADLRAEHVKLGADGSTFDLVWPEGRVEIKTPLLGHFNVANTVAAIGLAYAHGKSPADLVRRIAAFGGVPGRMEKVEAGQPFQVLVDYAHTDDALSNALTMLREITPGKLLVVFGCGGDRDRTKRPKMTHAVQNFADYAWATADNPRKEDLGQIFEDMQGGVSVPERISFVEDRRHAISLAMEQAGPGDCLLIAGKGHETYQEFADTVIPFDDRQVARELINLKNLNADA